MKNLSEKKIKKIEKSSSYISKGTFCLALRRTYVKKEKKK